jgi:predicted RNA polymerase sigma factor
MRRNTRLQDKTEILARDLGIVMAAGTSAPWEEGIGDDVLALVFTCCHPALSREARVALTLRMVGGLKTEEIARAFLVDPRTVGQRISRAKKTLSQERAPFAAPEGAELAERLPGVLEVIYLIFNEGYAATQGEQWMRPALVEDALRLGRVLAGLAPREPEVHGLVALMELQASRMRARRGPGGRPVLLMDQDRGRWDLLLIGRGLRALDRAEALGGALGPYAVQAAIAACHARARTPEATDWVRISALYDRLSEVAPSPVVDLNRAVALGMAYGPEAGLALVEAIAETGALDGYHLLPSVRGEMLERLGRDEEARAAFAEAAELTANEHERAILTSRASPPRP